MRTLPAFAVGLLSIGAILVMFLPTSAIAGTTTTVIGWLIPDGPHWNNGIGAFVFPIMGVALFAGMGRVLQLEGDFGVTLVLAGLTIGGLLAMLSINASSNNVLPFTLVIIPGVDLLIWVWKGGG